LLHGMSGVTAILPDWATAWGMYLFWLGTSGYHHAIDGAAGRSLGRHPPNGGFGIPAW
jgi:hypothetical protein